MYLEAPQSIYTEVHQSSEEYLKLPQSTQKDQEYTKIPRITKKLIKVRKVPQGS